MKKMVVAAAMCSGIMMSLNAAAQIKDKCGNDVITQYLIQNNPDLQYKFDKYVTESNQFVENYIQESANSANKGTGQTILPIVFHVVLTQAEIDQIGGTQGIYDRVVKQLDVINTDYNARNSDSSAIPTVFKPLFGKVGISFALAHRTPTGTGTIGVEIRVAASNFTGFSPLTGDMKHNSTGGLDPWDNTKYINVWVVNITGGSVLGFGYSPNYADNLGVPQETGVVIHYGTLGKKTATLEYYVSGADKGRTLTHELGHFFNLWHVWGNTAVGSGVCTDDDGVSDTPPQKDANQSCPSFPKTNCTNSNGGEMFMNYMDYPGDACVHMFSKGQVTRMQAQIATNGPSYQLTQHPELLLWPTDVSDLDRNNSVDVYPNPASDMVYVSLNASHSELKSINIVNYLGQLVISSKETSNNGIYTFNLSGLPKGMYAIQCNFAEGTVTRKVVLQ